MNTALELVKGTDRDIITLPSSFEPRMCHTTSTTQCCEGNWLMSGGRKSPDQPLKDCWLLHNQSWQRADDLPIPLYRHCQTQVRVFPGHNLTPTVLVYGGKTLNNVVSSKWLLWRESAGWVEVVVDNVDLIPRFGAVMVSHKRWSGVMFGGMTKDGTICHDFWLWTITCNDESGWRIRLTEQSICKEQSDVRTLRYLYRFGASLEHTYHSFLLIGGVADEVIPECYEVIEISSLVSFVLLQFLLFG